MKKSSIKKTLPEITGIMTAVLIVMIVSGNIMLQTYMQHQNQKENSYEVFGQLKQTIEMNEEDLSQAKQEFAEKCIQSAEMAAYFLEYFPDVSKDLTQTRELAKKLNVDELHYFTTEGEIYFGTHPEYYGYTFESGEQMQYFLPMLKDRSLKLCQEITPNTAEGKEMQYAAVWLEDGSGIVQIGMEPRRLMEEISDRTLTKLIASIPMDLRGYLHIVDKNTKTIIASTAEDLIGVSVEEIMDQEKLADRKDTIHFEFRGKRFCSYTEEYGNYIFVRSYLSKQLMKEMLLSTGLVLIYIVIVAIVVIGVIAWYVNRKLSTNLAKIVEQLKKIEQGHLENIEFKTGIIEFDELTSYVNQLLKSIRLNWNKLSYVIDQGRIPIGIFEKNTFYKKTFINRKLLNILGIEESEEMSPEALSQLVQQKLESTNAKIQGQEEPLYEYDKNGEKVYLRIQKIVDEQSIAYYVTDISLWWSEIHSLRERSNRDMLTGLYNRRGLIENLEELFRRPETLGYGMMLIADADGLKTINDRYGHYVGDQYLREVADILQKCAGDSAICARTGGDEFAVFLYHSNSSQELEEVVEKIQKERGREFLAGKENVHETVEFSIGYVFYPMDAQEYPLLMHMADENMYRDKERRNHRMA